jgi:integrase
MTKITELTIKELKPETRITDDAIKGFVARCLPSGEITFGYQYTNKKTGKRKWMGIGLHGNVTVARARELATEYAGRVAGHKDPAAELKVAKTRADNSVNFVLDKWLTIRVKAEKHLRSAGPIEANLANHVREAIGAKCVYDVTRGDIMAISDTLIENGHASMAGVVLAHLRAAFNWWMLRDDKFKSPIVRGMVERDRGTCTRVLTANEIADIWRALDEREIEHVPETFAAFVRVLLLTACRLREVAGMHTSEIFGDRWVIPAARYKTKVDHVVPLIPPIRKLLPTTKGFVFGAACAKNKLIAGEKPFSGFVKPKIELDKAIARIRKREGRAPMPAWTFHDLRRTARTLMTELRIDRDAAEACLGHTIGGVEAVYNRHKYWNEKVEALTKLADHIDRITRPTTPAAKLRLVAG